MKQCTKCGESRALSEFRKSSTTKDKLTTHCRFCLNAYSLQYRKANKEYFDQYGKEYAKVNAETAKRRTREWIKNNPERRKQLLKANYEKHQAAGTLDQYYGNVDKEQNRERSKQWRELNRGKVNAQIALRRTRKLQATPPWAELDKIAEVYEQARLLTELTGVEHQVDHIIPLKSKNVCGLHCLANLQILTATENNRKKCKLIEAL